MQETKILEDQIAGMKTKLKQLRSDKDLFVEAQGNTKQAENLSAEAVKKREEASTLKTTNAELIAQKNAVMAKGLSGMVAKIKELLPEGEPIVEVKEEGEVFIGWKNAKGNIVAYSGLSGGEKISFDNALCHALKANIIVSEFAELDDSHLPAAMSKFTDPNIQVLLSTCHTPGVIPDDWKVVRL